MIKTLAFPFPPRRCPGLKIILPFFFLIITPLPHPSSYKNLTFCTTSWSALLVTGWAAAQTMNHLINPIRSLDLLNEILMGYYKI